MKANYLTLFFGNLSVPVIFFSSVEWLWVSVFPFLEYIFMSGDNVLFWAWYFSCVRKNDAVLLQSLSLWFVAWNPSWKEMIDQEARFFLWGLETWSSITASGMIQKAESEQAALWGSELPIRGTLQSIRSIHSGHLQWILCTCGSCINWEFGIQWSRRPSIARYRVSMTPHSRATQTEEHEP